MSFRGLDSLQLAALNHAQAVLLSGTDTKSLGVLSMLCTGSPERAHNVIRFLAAADLSGQKVGLLHGEVCGSDIDQLANTVLGSTARDLLQMSCFLDDCRFAECKELASKAVPL